MCKIFKEFKKLKGFKFNKYEGDGLAGKSLEYKYYPSYMKDTHYTMIIFSTHCLRIYHGMTEENVISKDYRLYIHKNSDGSFVDSPFQQSHITESDAKYVLDGLHEEFEKEYHDIDRKQKLKTII